MTAQWSAGSALNVILLGPPGAGKGTQAERLGRSRALPRVSTGDILREAVQTGTALGCIAKATMEAGSLVADDVMIGIAQERLDRADARNGFVLDGFPRTVEQAAALDRIMDGRGPLVVLDIVVPEDVLVRRLAFRRVCSRCGANAPVEWTGRCGKCGGALIARADDGDAIVRERLTVYQRQSRPLVDYYSGRGNLRTIDGHQPPELVSADVEAAINDLVAKET